MAILLSNELTKKDNNLGLASSGEYLGVQKVSKAVISIDVEPSSQDVILFTDISSSAIINKFEWINTRIDTDSEPGIGDIGIYAGEDFIESNGTVHTKNSPIIEDAFYSVFDKLGEDTRFDPVTIRFFPLGTRTDLKDAQNELWQIAGLAEDPFKDLRIGYLFRDAVAQFQPGDIVIIIYYTS